MAYFLIINPNTSEKMTNSIEKTVKKYIHRTNKVDVIKAEMGPRSLETFYEYNLATLGVIMTLQNTDMSKYDGILLACFGDPGLYALKEISNIPLIGIAEASLSTSLLLGSKFAIITALPKAVPMMKNMVEQYGLQIRMTGVYSIGLPVLELEKDEKYTSQLLLDISRKAVNNGAEVIILGCAGLTGFSDVIEKELNISVLDPVRVGIKTLEAIVESKLKLAKNGLYKTPDYKEILNMDFIK